MNPQQTSHHQCLSHWRRMTHSQRSALRALADGPAVASHPRGQGRFWTLYRAPISRTTVQALDRAAAVTVTVTPTAAGAIESAGISQYGRDILAAVNLKENAA